MFSALSVTAKTLASDLAAAPLKSSTAQERSTPGATDGGFAAAMKRETQAQERAAAPDRAPGTATVAPAAPAAPTPGPARAREDTAHQTADKPAPGDNSQADDPTQRTTAGGPSATGGPPVRPAPAGQKSGSAAPSDRQADAADAADSGAGIESGLSGKSGLSSNARRPGLPGFAQAQDLSSARRARSDAVAKTTAPSTDEPLLDPDLPLAGLPEADAVATAASVALSWPPGWPPAMLAAPGQGSAGALPGEPTPAGTAAVAQAGQGAAAAALGTGTGSSLLAAATGQATPGPAGKMLSNLAGGLPGARRSADADATGRTAAALSQDAAVQSGGLAQTDPLSGQTPAQPGADVRPVDKGLRALAQTVTDGSTAAAAGPVAALALASAANAAASANADPSPGPNASATATPSSGAGAGSNASSSQDLLTGSAAALAAAAQTAPATPQSSISAQAILPADSQGQGDKSVTPPQAGTPVVASAGGFSATGPTGTAAARPMAEARVSVALNDPGFGAALGAQVSLLTRGGLHEARLQLNPAEMGPITVQIAVEGAAARVHFQADLAATRAVIEASLPALASSLNESGLTLTGGGVSQQGQQADQQPQQQPGRQVQAQPAAPGRQTAGGSDDGQGVFGRPRALTASRGLVDLVA